MKISKKLICLALSLLLIVPLGAFSVLAVENDYTIVSPYENVIWEGDGAWGAYKGTLHSHTTYSDADVDLATMVKAYYAKGFDFLANADHGVTGVEWNKAPKYPFLYNYQYILGNKLTTLTDEEYEGIITGTYNNRGKKMTCVVGANELNDLTLTKCHVNGYFLPEGVGTGFRGGENAYEAAIKFTQDNGGISHINHPGDWLESNSNPEAVNTPENVAYFSNLVLKYDSCYGIEIFNEDNGTTGYDRILWDNMLMYTLPYGKTVIGYANTDAHDENNIDTSFMTFMMEENDVDHIRETMENGAFFSTTRSLRANEFNIGPAKAIEAANTELAYPMFTKVEVDGHKITVEATDADTIQWIANGEIICSDSMADGEFTLDLDTIDGAEDFLYVRAEIISEGGMTATQALIIDNGEAPIEFNEENRSLVEKFIEAFRNSLLYVIIQEIIRAI
ncbi:MAG: hypothetical protein E7535_11315 [Ruminococcaceae bacterium]|nr:hypothetical protein [Oscillospiraceae bacterium]